jgi:hypothetical protein
MFSAYGGKLKFVKAPKTADEKKASAKKYRKKL